jgi:broad specificity phosphatase PhoE
MTRSRSEVTFPSPDSYAFSYGTDLGFSLFLERRCKRIYFIGNAEGLHNTVSPEELREDNGGATYFDPCLTTKGKEECFNLQMDILHRVHPIDFQLIVVSPLTRALQTAELAVGNLPRATPTHSRAASRAVSPQPEPLTMINGSAGDRDLGREFAALDRAMLAMSLDAQAARAALADPNGTAPVVPAAAAAAAPFASPQPAAAAAGAGDWGRARSTVPMVATELCRERVTGLPCDRRRPLRELRAAFPRVSFALIADDDDPAPPGAAEDKDMCGRRAARFLQWLCARPEQRIAVVSHSGFLLHLFERCGLSRHRQLGPKDVGELRRRPLHAEMRAVLLAAHRKVEPDEIRHGLAELLAAPPTSPLDDPDAPAD